MKTKLVKLLIIGFVLAILGASSGQCDSRRYSGSFSEGIGQTKPFDGGDPVPICFPGDKQCWPKFDGGSRLAKLFDGPFPEPSCFPGDQLCRPKFDGGGRLAKLFDGPGPEPSCFPGDQLCRPKG
jgi:hypothetical protein